MLAALPSPGFTVGTQRDSDVTVLSLSGELDLETAPVVRKALSACEAQPTAKLVLDLTELRFIDSIGLHLLVELYQRLAQAETPTLEIRGATPPVRRVFAIAGLDRVLPLV